MAGHDTRWMDRAACAGLAAAEGNYDTFYANTTDDRKRAREEYCRICPVWRECLDYAFACRELSFGTMGGLTAFRRRALHNYRKTFSDDFDAIVDPVVDLVSEELTGGRADEDPG